MRKVPIQNVVFSPTDDQRRVWTAAAWRAGYKRVEDWMIASLDAVSDKQIAAAEEAARKKIIPFPLKGASAPPVAP